MTNYYFVLVDPRDSEKFRQFKLSEYNKDTKNILNKHNSTAIWSFHKVEIKEDTWNKISENDFVYFSLDEEQFKIAGKVSKKINDENIGETMWPGSINTKQITYFLLFSELKSSSIFYQDMMNYAKTKLLVPSPGIYEIKDESYKQIEIHDQKIIKKFTLPEESETIPEKNLYEVNRFLRDPEPVSQLKKLYHNKCQICGFTFEYESGKFYSEVHHYNPLNEGGNDDFDNMIVVCPNHHSQFDYKMIAIDMDGDTIIDRQGTPITKIIFDSTHHLSEKNLSSQLREQ